MGFTEKRQSRQSAGSDFYENPKWEQKRISILRRDKYQCQISKRYGLMREATIVHHIFPLDEFPEYGFEDWNLISLSLVQHNKMHDRMTNRLTEEGAELLRRTARRNNIQVPEKYLQRQRHGRHKRME